jgi:hypothetical protein
MIATPTAIERAFGDAQIAVNAYNQATVTLTASARQWDELAAQLTVAASKLPAFAADIARQMRAQANEATARAQRQRAFAAVQARALLAGMNDFVPPAVRS